MNQKREHAAGTLPVLVPLYGAQDKKPRQLDRDVVAMGRGRGCDIGLDAPDVSTLHCVVYRAPDGLRVRDCGSRTGTRVNGGAIRLHLLADDDVLQVGPFSFTVKIPASFGPDPKMLEAKEAQRRQRSRRNLIRLALDLRGKLKNAGTNPRVLANAATGEANAATGEANAAAAETELNRKASGLRERVRQKYDQRLSQLELSERELQEDRDRLQKEREAHQERVRKMENELAIRLEQVEQEVHQRWQDFQQRCLKEDNRLAAQSKPQRPADIDVQKQHEALAEGRRVLEEWTAKLQKEKEQVEARSQQISRGVQDLQLEQGEMRKMKEQWTAQQAESSQHLEKQQSALSQAEAALREQRADLAQMMTDLRELQSAIRKQQGVDVQAIQRENEELRRLLTEAERRLGDTAVAPAAGEADEAEKLRAENDLLQRLLEEKEQLIQDLRERPAAAAEPKQPMDVESYEAELNQYRQQLESDRTKLNKEIDQLRARNAELDEATRELEMEMSKERAELGRERTRLDRLRDEVRTELERVQRDNGVRESLAPVQKLREEMNQKKQGNGVNLNDRLKGFRNRLSDS